MFKMSDRNRALYAAYEAGHTIEQLCAYFDVSGSRARVILTDEKNRQAVSPDPFYCEVRRTRSF